MEDNSKEAGEACKFIFKKRTMKNRGTRKRKSSSNSGKFILNLLNIIEKFQELIKRN